MEHRSPGNSQFESVTAEGEGKGVAGTAGWNLKNSYARLPAEFYTTAAPTVVRAPKLVVLNAAVARLLGLEPTLLNTVEQVACLAGNQLLPGSTPLAQAYAGHQFGGFTMLGDGRAILLGEQQTPSGALMDVQLKGAGQTAYSRRGDGRASLGPMLREYIISHAMYALGIPTTLSLAVVATGEPVYRNQVEPGAVLTRIAASHLRVGTFQYAATRQEVPILRALADYTIHRHFPQIKDPSNPYLELLRMVTERQAALVAQWMLVGFIHGVMNTDNVSIAGETIDYGPCAFMNGYDPGTVYSSIDHQGRYAYQNQPAICQWNLARFAETLIPLLHDDTDQAIVLATEVIRQFPDIYQQYWLSGMRRKLGMLDIQSDDQSLVDQLLDWMNRHQADFTNTFRDLTMDRCQAAVYDDAQFQHWLSRWKHHLAVAGIAWNKAQAMMQQSNPAVIPRNYRVEEALSAAVEHQDLEPLNRLLTALSKPYEESPANQPYRQPPSDGDVGYCTYCGT